MRDIYCISNECMNRIKDMAFSDPKIYAWESTFTACDLSFMYIKESGRDWEKNYNYVKMVDKEYWEKVALEKE